MRAGNPRPHAGDVVRCNFMGSGSEFWIRPHADAAPLTNGRWVAKATTTTLDGVPPKTFSGTATDSQEVAQHLCRDIHSSRQLSGGIPQQKFYPRTTDKSTTPLLQEVYVVFTQRILEIAADHGPRHRGTATHISFGGTYTWEANRCTPAGQPSGQR